jgi:hypothetical protein
MSKGPDGKPQVSATTTRPDGARTNTTAGGGQADSKQVSGPMSTGAGATDTGASGTGAGTAGGNSGGAGNTPAPQQTPDLNKTLERLNQTMENMGKAKPKTANQNISDTHRSYGGIKRAIEDFDGNQAVGTQGANAAHIVEE